MLGFNRFLSRRLRRARRSLNCRVMLSQVRAWDRRALMLLTISPIRLSRLALAQQRTTTGWRDLILGANSSSNRHRSRLAVVQHPWPPSRRIRHMLRDSPSRVRL